ncbi:Cof-type HAD-IIB family hydrolase [Lactobacillus johnsonii]|uniref:Cof-type HAD-IIB family hydrolase n=1 Tax=Lactobacillus johnsonii TaxID=33959 RepID=UPI001CC0022D|nr:Cof-type HAD-IIB family hydrolase [Lactobacillus johnsonii]MBZ4028356.1 Cof-type HAD-IIB family hydrolase [Lactobacillus johnsonii]
MIKLIAVDMDGTFLRDDKSYNEEKFTRIYQKLEKKDIKFTIASGNQYYQIATFFKDFPNVIYVAENGALVRTKEKILALHAFSEETVKKIEDFLLKQSELQFLVSGAESAYFPVQFTDDYYEISTKYYYRLKKIHEFNEIDDKVLKFSISCPDKKTNYYVDLLKKNLGRYCNVTSSGHGEIDLILPEIHKAHGLAELGQVLEISLSDMTAFGDGRNDLEMIKEVGDGVAMSNADPAVLKVADHTTTSNNEQGVLTYIENNIL